MHQWRHQHAHSFFGPLFVNVFIHENGSGFHAFPQDLNCHSCFSLQQTQHQTQSLSLSFWFAAEMSSVNALQREIMLKKNSGGSQCSEGCYRATTFVPFSHPVREYLGFRCVGQTLNQKGFIGSSLTTMNR